MTVTVKDKKEFIKWFLKNYQMKRKESMFLLNYLLNNDEILENTHFVEESHYCPKALIISSKESIRIPFRFYYGSIMSADIERAHLDIKNNKEEELYIELNFPNSMLSNEYLSVLEENPYMPKQLYMSDEDIEMIEEVIQESMRQFAIGQIEKQIDEALDQGDKERFLELTSNISEVLN